MSQTFQISCNKVRLIQLDQIKNSQSEYKNMVLEDVAKSLLFKKIDELAADKRGEVKYPIQ